MAKNSEPKKDRALSAAETAERNKILLTIGIVVLVCALIVLIVVLAVKDNFQGTVPRKNTETTTTESTDSGSDTSSSDLSDIVAGAVEDAAPSLNTTEGTVVNEGDTVAIDFVGKKDGVAFDGGTGSYDLTLGSGQFIPGFEEGLMGHSVGETVDLNLTFPEEYQAEELAGQDVVFTVTINGVYETE